MSNNSIVPAALANSPEFEKARLRAYLDSEDGRELIFNMEIDLEAVDGFNADQLLSETRDAEDVAGFLDQIEHSYSAILWHIREIKRGYVNALGIPDAVREIANGLAEGDIKRSGEAVASLRRGIEKAAVSDLPLPADLHENLMKLGMPTHHRYGGSRRLIKTFRDASYHVHEWAKGEGEA